MHMTLRIALRFLLAKKRAMQMSLAGIAFGVGFIVLTQAVTSGFEFFFIRTILGTDGAIRIEDKFQASLVSISTDAKEKYSKSRVTVESDRKWQEGINEPRLLMDALKRFEGITGMSEVVRGTVQIQSATREDTAQVFGIELENHLAVSDLGKQIVLGSLEDFRSSPSGLLVGSALAQRLRLEPGSPVYVSFAGQAVRYRVAAIYETGLREIDRFRIFAHIGEARTLLKRPFGATFLQIALSDSEKAPQIARQIELVTSHRATSWQEREQVWLDVFSLFHISAAITVSTIIIVSGLGMFNTLAMIVMEKTREIAILRSMGYTRGDIATTFMLQGLIVLIIGVTVGWGFGALATWVTENLPFRVRGIFSTDHLVVTWNWLHYAGAGVAAAIVVVIASWLPARRAAALEPASVIRGTSQ